MAIVSRNGPDARIMTLEELPERLVDDGRLWSLRPVDDSKEGPGNVKSTTIPQNLRNTWWR